MLQFVISCIGCGIVRVDEKKVEEDMEDVFRNLLISVQEGDGTPTITATEQIELTAAAIWDWLEK